MAAATKGSHHALRFDLSVSVSHRGGGRRSCWMLCCDFTENGVIKVKVHGSTGRWLHLEQLTSFTLPDSSTRCFLSDGCYYYNPHTYYLPLILFLFLLPLPAPGLPPEAWGRSGSEFDRHRSSSPQSLAAGTPSQSVLGEPAGLQRVSSPQKSSAASILRANSAAKIAANQASTSSVVEEKQHNGGAEATAAG